MEDCPSKTSTLQALSQKKPERVDLSKRSIITRPGIGTSGRRISLLANHFNVQIKNPDANFYHYSVSITYENNEAVESKVIGRKVIDKLCQTYSPELAGKRLAYDGDKNLFTVGPLPLNKLEFTVVLEESIPTRSENPAEVGKRSKRSLQSKTFKIEISYAAKIPLKSVYLALQGAEQERVQDVLRVLDIVLRQQAANRGCLLVRQSFFHDDSRMFTDIGGGVTGVRGFHSSFLPTQAGLSLNMDVSTTMILKPGPVMDFLLANQNVRESRSIDWVKARKMLKNMRVKAIHNNMEFKIIGLSEKPCNQQLFSLKVKRGGKGEDDFETKEITIYEYFVKHRKIPLTSTAYYPCLDVGKPKKPSYLPIELCSLVSLQRYTKALSGAQRASLVEKSRQKPRERANVIKDALTRYCYDSDTIFSDCGISIEKELIQVDGRVLDPPKLVFGNSEDCSPRNGRWNFNNKKFLNPIRIDHWALVNFSAECNTSRFSLELIDCARKKGIHIERPYTIVDEDPKFRKASPVERVEKMFEEIMNRLPGPPEFLLCFLPERKNSEIYGPWKKKCLCDLAIITQCVAPTKKINDQYLTNLLLKINSKLGGFNSLLAIEHSRRLPLINHKPTMILGMDVSHGSPGRSDIPSVAAVVASRSWPLISRYRAAVRTQSSKVEMIESLFKPLANEDDGIMRELFKDFYETSNGRKPTQIIIFRDGVSESQFAQVLNVELDQIIKAYMHLGESDVPKFTVIVAQKSHHTRIFQSNENVPSGTIVDTKVVHPRNYDFYMCAQAGIIGTSRPAHYHVLLDEIGFSPDELQNLIHSLSYVYQRSTTAISIVAPICYAHLAAHQMSQFFKFDDSSSEMSSERKSAAVPTLPRLHTDVAGSMFFC